jgi:H2-forming N5,N10-methylenetetrahydromethanopterin dehydrogenase-like enzyme
MEQMMNKPVVVTLCGSARFVDAFKNAQLEETMDGKIVLTIGCNMKMDREYFNQFSEEDLKEIKGKLDELHLRKIDISDEILVLNVGGYIGESTSNEIEYARKNNKTIKYWEKL